MMKKQKILLLRTITALMLVSLPFLGSDCEDVINQLTQTCNGNAVNLIGTWRFIQNVGGLRDVCLGETVQFSTSSAVLTCPNQTAITRTYSVSTDNVLTYNESGMQYCVAGDEDELQLTGLNNDRILYYIRISSDNPGNTKADTDGKTPTVNIRNSSEGR